MVFYKNLNLIRNIIKYLLLIFILSLFLTLFINKDLLRYSIFVNLTRLVGLYLMLFSFFIFASDLVKQEKKLHLKYIAHILLVFISILGLISCFLSENFYFAFFGVRRNYLGINYNDGYLTLLAYFGFFMGAFTLNKNSQIKIVSFFSVISYLVGLVGLFSSSLKVFNISDIIDIKCSLFYNSNHYGYYLTIAIFLSMYNLLKSEKLQNRIFNIIGFTILSASLIYTNCRGALLSITITIILYIIFININKNFKKRYSYLPLLILFLTTIFINILDTSVSTQNRYESILVDTKSIIENPNGSDTSGSGRWKLWKSGFDKFIEKPIIGHGINGVYYSNDIDNTYFIRVHNEYLEYAFTYGIFSIFSYLIIILIIGIDFLKNFKDKSFFDLMIALSVLSYLISAFFGNTKPYTTPYLFMCLGFLYTSCSFTKVNCNNR